MDLKGKISVYYEIKIYLHILKQNQIWQCLSLKNITFKHDKSPYSFCYIKI